MTERANVYVKYQPGQPLPKVGDIIDVQGLAKWKCKVLSILQIQHNDDGSTTLKMKVNRWIVEE